MRGVVASFRNGCHFVNPRAGGHDERSFNHDWSHNISRKVPMRPQEFNVDHGGHGVLTVTAEPRVMEVMFENDGRTGLAGEVVDRFRRVRAAA